MITYLFFFLMLRPHPRSTLFPYTTLFRSAIIYEMLTGRAAFARATGAETIAAILKDDPPAEASFAPPALERVRSEEHTSELQSRLHLVCRLLLEKKK